MEGGARDGGRKNGGLRSPHDPGFRGEGTGNARRAAFADRVRPRTVAGFARRTGTGRGLVVRSPKGRGKKRASDRSEKLQALRRRKRRSPSLQRGGKNHDRVP